MNSCATSHVSNDAISSFDAGGVAKRFRHEAIFGALDEFRERDNFLVNDSADGIDCAVCVQECPVNAELAPPWKTTKSIKAALPDAEEWAKVDVKPSEHKR